MLAGSLSVRNGDDELIARLKCHSVRHQQSAEIHNILRFVVKCEVETNFTMWAAELRRATVGPHHTLAKVFQSEGRNER